jgi:glycine cleavage system aminomethyltransferase T
LVYHNEPIWRDGAIVGRISSGMFGHALGKSLGMGYVELGAFAGADAALLAANYEIEVAGVNVPATASLAGFYDPQSLRVKGL